MEQVTPILIEGEWAIIRSKSNIISKIVSSELELIILVIGKLPQIILVSLVHMIQ